MSNEETQKVGMFFGDRYILRGPPTSDSDVMRRRLAAHVADLDEQMTIGTAMEKRLGIRLPWRHRGYDWQTFFDKADLLDVLHTTTLIFRVLAESGTGAHSIVRARRISVEWRDIVAQVFAETNVGYSVDEACGVRRAVDAAFDASIASAISALEDRRYAAVRAKFEKGAQHLIAVPPLPKHAVEEVFDAIETLFVLMFNDDPPRFAGGAAIKRLKVPINDLFKRDDRARKASVEASQALGSWADAAQNFRHERGEEDLWEPPEELATLLVSQGAGFLRWLAYLDRLIQDGSKTPASTGAEREAG